MILFDAGGEPGVPGQPIGWVIQYANGAIMNHIYDRPGDAVMQEGDTIRPIVFGDLP